MKNEKIENIETEKLKSMCWDRQEVIDQLSNQLHIARSELAKRNSSLPKTSPVKISSKKSKKDLKKNVKLTKK